MLKPVDWSEVIDLKVTEQFDYACKKMLEANEELKVPLRFIAKHERRELVLRKLSKQIYIFEKGLRAGQKTAYNRYQLIAAHAQLFIKFAIQERDNKLKSKAETYRETARERAMEEVKEMGIFKEIDNGKKTSWKA